jgi:hypothetical protein
MCPTFHLREDDLTPEQKRLLDAAYRRRQRPKCSREDFVDGYLACMVDGTSTAAPVRRDGPGE